MSDTNKEWTECIVLAERMPKKPEDLKICIDEKSTLKELIAVRDGINSYIETLEKENQKYIN